MTISVIIEYPITLIFIIAIVGAVMFMKNTTAKSTEQATETIARETRMRQPEILRTSNNCQVCRKCLWEEQERYHGLCIYHIKKARRLLATRQRHLCGICNKPLGSYTNIDHIIPKKRGGLNEFSNLQLVHPSCNAWKGNRVLQHSRRSFRGE